MRVFYNFGITLHYVGFKSFHAYRERNFVEEVVNQKFSGYLKTVKFTSNNLCMSWRQKFTIFVDDIINWDVFAVFIGNL